MKKELIPAGVLIITVFLAGTFPTLTAYAQSRSATQSAPLSAESVNGQVDRIFAQWNKPDSPGCAIAVSRDGQQVLARGYGMANLEYSVPMSPATVSETGSVAKQFTAAAIALLAQQGKLSLDDPVRKYLPEVPDFGAPVTIRQLLSHTSGLRDQNEIFDVIGLPMGRSVHTNDEILELVSRQKQLNFAPGEEYLYSNTGFTLLVHIVKQVSGQSFADFTQQHLFRPLGMTNTQWRDDFTRVVKNRATAYESDGKNGFRMNMPFGNVHGAGGLLTTVGDLLIWNENFASGRVGGRELTNQLQTRARLKDGREIDYALGLTVTEYKGVSEVSHGGATAGYRTFLVRYPGQRLSLAMLCNVTNVNTAKVAHQVADVFLAGQLKENKPPRVNVTAQELESKVGLYRNSNTDEVQRFFIKDGKLMVGYGSASELMAMAPNKFQVVDALVEFTFEGGGDGAPLRVRRVTGNYPPVVYTAVTGANPSLAQLAEYVGSYYSDELDVTHTVTVKDGKLLIRLRPTPGREMEPTYADAFVVKEVGHIRFTRDAAGKVDGFNVFTGRIRHLRFIRR